MATVTEEQAAPSRRLGRYPKEFRRGARDRDRSPVN